MAITKLKPVDVVVVGAGVAGMIVCKELADAGLQVVGLERGRMVDPQHDFAMPYVHDELKGERHNDLFQDLSRETITFRNAMNYSYQTMGHVTLFFEDKVFNGFMGGGGLCTAIDEFNGDNFDHAGLGFIGGAYVIVNSRGAAPIRSHPVPPGTPRWGSGWKKAVARYYDRSFSISSHAGCQSYRTNYLDLDPTYRDAHGLPLIRMTFDWHENERKMSAWITNKAAEVGKAIGPSKMSVHPVAAKYSIVPYQVNHNTGGAIMGADPATSAVNKYLQSWDVPNVFVIGASAFPQNSANAPTGTVGALACRAADSIKDHYLKRLGALT